MNVPESLSCVSAANIDWDAIVMGAGVAGALAARELARSGLRVLLVEKRAFPRSKVCGACLNAAALRTIAQVGLAAEIEALAGPVLSQIELRRGSSALTLPLPDGRAISRELLDLTLVRAAMDAGAEFLPETGASVGAVVIGGRVVELTQHGQKVVTQARAVIVATGLGPQGLPNSPDWKTWVAPASRIGAGCVLDQFPDEYVPGTIWMVVGDGGYVGLVRVENGDLNVAAAFDLDLVRRSGSPGLAARQLLNGAGCPIPPQLLSADWQGTLLLTRQTTPVANNRVFLIGDAASYVEPFTGEGMAWALSTGLHVVPWVQRAVKNWSEDLAACWIREHRQLVRQRQNLCRLLTQVLRWPRLLDSGTYLLKRWPGLLQPVLSRLNSPIL